MKGQPYTLAMYRVMPGRQSEFTALWRDLASTFSSLPNPPLWGTLIRSTSDPTVFYSFGPWRSVDHIAAMRANPDAQEAFGRIAALCLKMAPGNYEVVEHVVVVAGQV